MRSLAAAASLSADHVERRPRASDTPPKKGDLGHLFSEAELAPATPPIIVAASPAAPAPTPAPAPIPASPPEAERDRAWPAFPHREERREIEARGECVPVTRADLMRRARSMLYAPPPRRSSSLPKALAGMLNVVGLGRRSPS